MSKTGADLPATDAALVQKITQRDEAALAALYDRYAGMLSSVLNRILRDTQAAEEILQDIFYQLWCGASRFDPARGSLPGWLLVIARNRAISRLRRHNPAAGEEILENTVVMPFDLRIERRATAAAGARERRPRIAAQRAARCCRACLFRGHDPQRNSGTNWRPARNCKDKAPFSNRNAEAEFAVNNESQHVAMKHGADELKMRHKLHRRATRAMTKNK